MTDYDALAAALALPEAFAQSGEPFWEDEHISQRMLTAHLDPGFDGASRLPEFMDRSTAFMAQQMPPARYPRLLDVGCGPGLYAQRLCRLGYSVVGLDFSQRSIAFARQQAQNEGLAITYQLQNYLDWQPQPAMADAAVMIYCDYGALAPAGRKTVMEAVYTALAPGGCFFLDVFSPQKLAAFKEETWWQHCPKGGFWSADPYVALFTNRRYPDRVSLEQTVLVQPQGLRRFYLWNQFFTPPLLAKEAAAAGFVVKAFYGDAAGAPQTEESPTLAVLLEKP